MDKLAISDGLLVILFTLFVASTVNERIVDFVKTHFPNLWLKHFNFKDEIKRRRRVWTLTFVLGFLTALIIDINLIEIAAKNKDSLGGIGGLFSEIRKEGMNSSDGELSWFFSLLGLVFTAVFISMGSKFWHDLLDITLMVKRAKQKIHNFDPKTITEIEEIDNYLEENEYKIAQKALENNRKHFEAYYKGHDVTFTVGHEHIDAQYRVCIQVYIRNGNPGAPLDKDRKVGRLFSGKSSKKKSINTTPESIENGDPKELRKLKEVSYVAPYGYVFRFPVVEYYPGVVDMAPDETTEVKGVKLVETPGTNIRSLIQEEPSTSRDLNETIGIDTIEKIKAQTNYTIYAGGALFNERNFSNKGTFGCLVRKIGDATKTKYMLTCYHCVKSTNHHWDKKITTGDKDLNVQYKHYPASVDFFKVGSIEVAYLDSYMDFALIRVNSENEELVSNYYFTPNKTIPLGVDTVTRKNGTDRRKIWFSGLTSGATEGFITNNRFPVEVRYEKGDEGKKVWLNDLIVFSGSKTKPYKKPCQKGDSGAVILDAETHLALGMIIAVDDKFGYAIPMKKLLDIHGLEIITDHQEQPPV